MSTNHSVKLSYPLYGAACWHWLICVYSPLLRLQLTLQRYARLVTYSRMHMFGAGMSASYSIQRWHPYSCYTFCRRLGWPLSMRKVSPGSPMVPYYRLRNWLCEKDDFAFRGTTAFHASLVTIVNESHQGVVQIKQHLRDLYWWPKMDSMVQTAFSSCQPC